jgi:hypothetical protein
MNLRGSGRGMRGSAIVLVIIVMALIMGAARAAAAPLITASPALDPAFSASVHDYVTRCDPGQPVTVDVRPVLTPVSVNGGPTHLLHFTAPVTLQPGQAFTIAVGSGASLQDYTVRCLPQDFPAYSVQRLGPVQAAYYLVTPDTSSPNEHAANNWVAMFNSDGVPVWWYQEAVGSPIDADLDPNGDLSWAVETIPDQTFGLPGGIHVEVHSLDGTLLNTLNTVGTPADLHEAWPLANGDFLIDSYVPRAGVDVSSVGLPSPDTVLDASFQEITPAGQEVYSWDSAGQFTPQESAEYTYFNNTPYPGLGTVWDWQHINSVEPYEQGYLVSMRNTNAVYYVRASDGQIVWKLGGTPTPQSLTILNDPDSATDFGAQHDARVWPDGTISVHDNGTADGRPPRIARFRIDEAAHTATLVQQITDPDAHRSLCCGSGRLLPGGDWVVAWGATPYMDEINSANKVMLRLKWVLPDFSYRAVPILPTQLDDAQLDAAMAVMYGTPAAG